MMPTKAARFSMTLLAISGLLWALLFTQSAAASDRTVKTILVLGDSLSAAYGLERHEGWVHLLQQRLNALDKPEADSSWNIANASISGETTSGGLARLPEALERYQPELVIVELGANDGLRGQSLQAMQANLSAIIDASKAASAKILLLGMRIPSNYGPAYTERFYQLYQRLANAKQVALVDFFLAPVALTPELFLEDGIHPNAEAQPLLLDHIWPVLEPLL